MTDKQIEQLKEALLRYVAVYGKTHLQADGLYTTAELMSKFGIVALPKNAVLLTDEKLELGEWEGEVQVMSMARQTYDACLKQTRKETAKEIFSKLREKSTESFLDWEGNICHLDEEYVSMRDIEAVLKQCGVEVE